MSEEFNLKVLLLIAVALTATFAIYAHQFLGVGQTVATGHLKSLEEIEAAKN